MAKTALLASTLFAAILVGSLVLPVKAFVPLARSLWDDLDDPFRVLEQAPFSLPKQNTLDSRLALIARANWKETSNAHIITLDVPGMKKQDVKIEVEENRVLKVSGERKSETEEEKEGDKWHRAERITGKFWRQFRLPANADLDHIKARLEDGVLRIDVPKLAEEKKRQNKVIDIAADKSSSGEDLTATKSEM